MVLDVHIIIVLVGKIITELIYVFCSICSYVEDNCDLFLVSRHQSLSHQNQSFHWALHFAVKSRTKRDPNLNFTNPQREIKDIPMSQLLPSKLTVDALTGTFPHIVARVVTKYMPAYKKFKATVLHHLPHKFTEEMSKPSQQVIILIN